MITVPESKKRKVLLGTKLSVDKLKRSEHEAGSQMDSIFNRDKSKVQAETNDEASKSAMVPRS